MRLVVALKLVLGREREGIDLGDLAHRVTLGADCACRVEDSCIRLMETRVLNWQAEKGAWRADIEPIRMPFSASRCTIS
jgi:hypothetical protein